MFSWCAYCQTLKGEVEPLDDFALSHGLCGRCEAKVRKEGDAFVGPPIQADALQVFLDLRDAGMSGDLEDCDRLLAKGMEAGMTPANMLLGLVQPALYEIGARWRRGETTVADEHRFSAWVERVLSRFEDRAGPPGPRPILLAAVEGNGHTLGLRMAAVRLRSAGFGVLTVYPGVPAEDLAALAARLTPSVLGLSVSMEEHLPAARRLVEAASRWRDPPSIVAGGWAFRSRGAPGRLEGARVYKTLDGFVDDLSRG